MIGKISFKCIILSPHSLIYQNEVQSIFLTGDTGEYELLAYHYPLLGVLKKGDVIIDWNHKVSINGGVVRFFANECLIMVEEDFRKKVNIK
ncbi:MAG: F0F1-type ATP synthase epsilon subunit [Lysobacterales bacterium]|jgi:F0F1-type ATP synthase epsilon subunit